MRNTPTSGSGNVARRYFDVERRRADKAEAEAAELRLEVAALRDAMRGVREHFDERVKDAVRDKRAALDLALAIATIVLEKRERKT
jgi:hypothetical protein